MKLVQQPPIPSANWPGGQLVLPPLLGIALALQAVSAVFGSSAVLQDDPAPPLAPSLPALVGELVFHLEHSLALSAPTGTALTFQVLPRPLNVRDSRWVHPA